MYSVKLKLMRRLFKLKDHNTSAGNEIQAGVITFSTMAYIIFVNPSLMQQTGMDFNSVLVATCLAAGIGSLLMGLLANYPFGLAPGMGLNAFFVFTVVLQLNYTWQQALAMVFISGILLIALTISGVRAKIMNAIPMSIRFAIPAGIGLFITFIGLNNAGVIRFNQGPIIEILLNNSEKNPEELIPRINNAPSQVLELGSFLNPEVVLCLLGIGISIILLTYHVKAALLISIVLSTVIGIPLGVTEVPDELINYDFSLAPTFMQMDFTGLLGLNESQSLPGVILTFITLLLSFSIVDLFDSVGTLIGTAHKGGFLDEKGKLPRINQALMADAVATSFGAVLGTSTTTTYIESGSGVMAGGRTGLTAITVAALFILSIFIAPLAAMVPAAATAPALVMVGMSMISSLKKIDLFSYREAIPAFLTVVLMPFTYSIANGIAFGLISYVIIHVVLRDFRKVPLALYVISFLFLLRYLLMG